MLYWTVGTGTLSPLTQTAACVYIHLTCLCSLWHCSWGQTLFLLNVLTSYALRYQSTAHVSPHPNICYNHLTFCPSQLGKTWLPLCNLKGYNLKKKKKLHVYIFGFLPDTVMILGTLKTTVKNSVESSYTHDYSWLLNPFFHVWVLIKRKWNALNKYIISKNND